MTTTTKRVFHFHATNERHLQHERKIETRKSLKPRVQAELSKVCKDGKTTRKNRHVYSSVLRYVSQTSPLRFIKKKTNGWTHSFDTFIDFQQSSLFHFFLLAKFHKEIFHTHSHTINAHVHGRNRHEFESKFDASIATPSE